MANPKLPIRVFYTRGMDRRLTEGRPKNENEVKWLQSEDKLREKSELFLSQIGEASDILRARTEKKNNTPAVLQVKTRVEARTKAKTNRAHIEEIFDLPHNRNVFGVTDEDDLLVKVDSQRDLEIIRRKLSDIDQYALGLSAFDSIEPFQPEVSLPTIETEEKPRLKIRFHNFRDGQLNRASRDFFSTECKRLEIGWKEVEYTSDITVAAVSDWSPEGISELIESGVALSVTEMPSYISDAAFSPADGSMEVILPTEGEEYPTLAVLDSGVAKIPQLEGWLLEKRFTRYPDEDVDRNHG